LSTSLSSCRRLFASLDRKCLRRRPHAAGYGLLATRKLLRRFEGGRLLADIAAGRGHCHRISNAYDRYLNKWFARVLNAKEAASLKVHFDRFQDFDGNFIDQMGQLATAAQRAAAEILRLLDTDPVKARAVARAVARNLVKPRQRVSETLVQLWQLQYQFTAMAGVV
jgi:hypothetical protein